MSAFFTYEEGSLLIRLVIAHLLTDFFLQPDKWVKDKSAKAWTSSYLFYHTALAGLLTFLLAGRMEWWWLAPLVFVAHYLTDGTKMWLARSMERKRTTAKDKAGLNLRLFLADQGVHVATLIVIWLFLVGKWHMVPGLIMEAAGYRPLLVVLGYMVLLKPVGFMIAFLTRRWLEEIDVNDSLADAGKWIGMLERCLIFTLVLIDQFSAIGFLITAKSILRLIDKPEARARLGNEPPAFSSRKHTEYVLIGTFLSIATALITGILVKAAL